MQKEIGDDMDNRIVGERISLGRKSKGLSQADLAKLVHISPQAVGKWERGESLPDIFMLGAIGEVIGTTDINYFLGKVPCKCKEGGCMCGCECGKN